jgi:hypothetical protein
LFDFSAFVDGDMSSARYYSPVTMTFDAQHESLLIADYKSQLQLTTGMKYISSRIRKLSLRDKLVTTVLGGPGNSFCPLNIY